MSSERHEQLRRIFAEACSVDAKELANFLDRACQDDPELRSEVEALLKADEEELNLLDTAEAAPGAHLLAEALARSGEFTDPDAALPKRIGKFQILRRLGEGGMSQVFEAIQNHPRRHVALKVVRPSMVTPSLLKRFQLETQIQARLNHPGIAQLYEVGGIGAGSQEQPYFAMELVEGEALRAYVESRGLDSKDRLRLVALLCDIVHHAHQQGVIHRDLKPSNILVTDHPSDPETGDPSQSLPFRLKVLDFGVARALSADLHQITLQTSMGQLIGTIPYMSPEQASGDPSEIDTRSDVYSLGVIAFELLTGHLPYEVRNKLPHEAVRIILEEEPGDFTRVHRSLRGDVETILRKALSKEKSWRYQSAAELAADIRRFLSHKPIDAQPASTLYQLRKFARRNKAVVGGIAATLVVTIVGTIVAASFAISANQKANELIRSSYAVGITAASNALDQEDDSTAAYYLDSTPPELRGWEFDYLKAKLRRQLGEWELPSPAMTRPVFDRSGQQMFAILRDGQIATWDADRGSLVDLKPVSAGVAVEPTMVSYPVLSGASLRYALRATDGGVLVGDLTEQGAPPIALEPEVALASPLAWDDSGEKLVYQADSTRIWDGQSSSTLHEEKFGRAAFSHSGDRIALAGAFTVVLVDAESGQELHRVTLDDTVTDMAFSPDDKSLAIAGHNRNVFLLYGDDLRMKAILPGHQELVFSLAWTRDSNQLITTSLDGTARSWDRTSPGTSSVIASELMGDTAVAIHPRSDHAITLGDRLTEFSLTDRSVLSGHESFAYRVSFSPDGTRLASSGFRAAQVYLWDVQRLELLHRFSAPEPIGVGLFDQAAAIAFSADGERLVSGWDGGSWHWATTSGEPLPGGSARSGESAFWSLLDDGSDLSRFAHFEMSPCESRITSPGINGSVVVRERESKTEIGRLEGHVGQVYCATFSPDGTRIATGGNDSTIRIWDGQSFELLLILRGHNQYVMDLEFSPDGTMLASASGDRTIRIWDTMTLRERREQAVTR